MRHIVKDYTTNAVKNHNAELQTAQLDENSLLNPAVYVGMTGNKLWHLVRDIKVIPHFWDVKHQMMQEQGGICCYCGLKIKFGEDRKATVEHLIPKSLRRELVGEYKNLLLSCSLTKNESDDLKTGTLVDWDVKHCDDTKGSHLLYYNPLQNDCGTRFIYDITGHVTKTDADSDADINTLNLDCQALVDRRKNALAILFDENGDILPDSDLENIANAIMQPTNGEYREFCFVIKSVIDNLLNP